MTLLSELQPSSHELATFAGGCFWCIESAFKGIKGVRDVVSGYTDGNTVNPTYEQVCSGITGHLEAVQLAYDPGIISYPELVEHFWLQIDPTDPGGQFVDRGTQYQTVIFYHTPEQKLVAEASKQTLHSSGKYARPIVTRILPYTMFYKAETHHQDYAAKHPQRYNAYYSSSGRRSKSKPVDIR